MTEQKLQPILANIFPSAHAAIEPAVRFPWHRDQAGKPQAWKRHSSQALSIDFFGTLSMASRQEQDTIMDRIASEIGVPGDGPWTVALESKIPKDVMREPRQTQVDALARGGKSLIFFECKFTEPGGSCSQTQMLSKGRHRGKRQCDGFYRWQSNPTNGLSARCALSAKGIRYWESIAEIFILNPDQDHAPCPFAGSWFQWMRNTTICHNMAASQSRSPAFVVVHADGFSVGDEAGDFTWQRYMDLIRPGKVACKAISYLAVADLAIDAIRQARLDTGIWVNLREWLRNKIDCVRATKPQPSSLRPKNT